MNTELSVASANLPALAEPANLELPSSTDYLAFLERSAKAARDVNFLTLAAAVNFIFASTILASKAGRKSRKELSAILVSVFNEQTNPNLNAGRSKRYKFAKLSLDMACHKEMHPLAMTAAKLPSIEAGATYLADQFAERARSVADLARHFGRENNRQKIDEEAVTQPFLIRLRALVERAKKANQEIPFTGSVDLLTPEATENDRLNLIRRLMAPTSDQAIPELIAIFDWFMRHRCGNA